MRYYPINLDISGRTCLVVGGGSVGTRKVKTLLKCGARVRVVAPKASGELRTLAADGCIDLKERPYAPADLEGVFLVIGATNDEAVNLNISRDAEARKILYNIADRPEACNFILPAIVNRGDLFLAVSTSGKSPALAKKLRKDLEKSFGDEYAVFLTLMGAVRTKLLDMQHEPEAHKQQFETLIECGLLEMIRGKNMSQIDALLRDVLGEGYTFDALMQSEKGTDFH